VVTLHELIQLADLRTLNAPGGRLARFGAGILMNAAARADVVCLTTRRYADWFALHRPDLAHRHIPIGSYHVPELLFFTTHAPFKGLELLLDAYRSLLPRYPDLHLTIAGAEHPRFPGYLDALHRQTPAGLPGVRWLGSVPDAAVRGLFADARVVVLPYLASTGSSSVVFQAAAWGRPVVASNIPDICALADENDLEIEFFQNGSCASLAAAIQAQLDSPLRRRSQVRHNFAALQPMGPRQTCRLYLEAFNQALENRQNPERLRIPGEMDLEYC
jgi:glycosyltransferase involved in cell wall biosynthesis